MPLSPHQVVLQSRLLEEPFPIPSLEIVEFFDEDEGELTFGLDVWFVKPFLVNHGIMRGNRDVFALLGVSGARLPCPGLGDCASGAIPGGFQCPDGRQPKRV